MSEKTTIPVAHRVVLVATENRNKMREIMAIIRTNIDPVGTRWIVLDEEFEFGEDWVFKRIDMPHNVLEVQADVYTVCHRKIQDTVTALNHLSNADSNIWGLLVEDTSLSMHAISGFPGVYIKHAVDGMGHGNLHLLIDAFANKGAEACCSLGWYCRHTGKYGVNTTSVSGKVAPPRGDRSHASGWDWNFVMDTTPKRTIAEITDEEKFTLTARARAIMVWVTQVLMSRNVCTSAV